MQNTVQNHAQSVLEPGRETVDFPSGQPVTLAARGLVHAAYRQTPPTTADLVFNTLIGWQPYFCYHVSRRGDFCLLYALRNNEVSLLPPLMMAGSLTDHSWGASFAAVVRDVQAWCDRKGMKLTLHSFTAPYLRCLPPGRFAVHPDRDSAEYVYTKDDLANLPGSRFSSKRNLIKQFSRSYAYRYESLNEQNRPAFIQALRNWQVAGKKDNELLGSAAYCMACRLAEEPQLEGVVGGLLLVDEKIVAITLGTIVDNFSYDNGVFSTVVVHHETALTEYKGVYQMINQLFCAHLPARVVYVNREEDLGITGLRKAKLSYHPCLLLEKNRLELR
jgi:hypothetical protein